MSDLPRPVHDRIQKSLGDDEPIVAGVAASMYYTPLFALLGTVFAVALGVATTLGLLGAFIVWVPMITLVVTMYPHAVSGEHPPIRAFPGGALLLVVTRDRVLLYRYGAFRMSRKPMWEVQRDAKVHVSACDLPGPGLGAGVLLTVPGGQLKLAVWRIKHVVRLVKAANEDVEI